MTQSLTVLDIAPVYAIAMESTRIRAAFDPAHVRGHCRIAGALRLTIATLAAKSRKAELIIVPALDILQSVPVLGFLTFTVVFFMGLFPGSQLGAELAAIFAIFTSQAWNMAFSFYQSLRTFRATSTR